MCQKFRSYLDAMEIELYNLIFITHNLNIMGPTEKGVFALIFECCFHHSKLKSSSLGDRNQEQKFCVSKNSKLIFNDSLVNRITLWDPCTVHCQINLNPLILPLLISSFQFISFQNFQQHFSFSHFPKLSITNRGYYICLLYLQKDSVEKDPIPIYRETESA